MSGQERVRRWLNNLTCKSRIDPEAWSSSDYELWERAVESYSFNPAEGDEAYWAHLALAETGHFRGTPFFYHMYPKLKALGRLRGISKPELFDNLSLAHLERLKSQLNTDELLTLAIHYELNEWVNKNPFLAESLPGKRTLRQIEDEQKEASGIKTVEQIKAEREKAGGIPTGSVPGKKTLARVEAEQEEADASSTASEASAEGTGEGHTGSTPPPAADATGEGVAVSRASEGRGGGALKRKGAPSDDERQSKRSRVMDTVKEWEGQSIFIADDDSDVL